MKVHIASSKDTFADNTSNNNVVSGGAVSSRELLDATGPMCARRETPIYTQTDESPRVS